MHCDQDFFLVYIYLIDSHVFFGGTGLGWVGGYLPIVVHFFRHLVGIHGLRREKMPARKTVFRGFFYMIVFVILIHYELFIVLLLLFATFGI